MRDYCLSLHNWMMLTFTDISVMQKNTLKLWGLLAEIVIAVFSPALPPRIFLWP